MNASAAPVTPAKPVPAAKGMQGSTAKISSAITADSLKNQAVFVQVTGTGAAATASSTSGSAATKAGAAKARKAQVTKTTAAVASTAKTEDAATKVLYQTANAVPGIAISTTDPAALEAVAARPDVVKIFPITRHTVENASAAQLTKALNVWKSLGVTGKGIKVGIVDTGIDYIHSDFGGVGTVEAFDAAQAVADAPLPDPWTPTAKVVGGYDFVGDAYDAGATGAAAVPIPDNDPLDCNGHGSHVAGTAAGFGVNADGSTFKGSYAGLTGDSLYSMKIGPGMAPEASLYAIKVFGCEGSTDATIQGLDYSLDPNNDGNFADKLDIINLSLGSDFGAADELEADVINTLAANGVLSVFSAGNSGDITDTGGSPGATPSALTVASSVDEYELYDGLKVNAPADVAGISSGQFSVAYDYSKPPVTGDVVALTGPANLDGCVPLSAVDAALVAGKVAWLEWDDNDATRKCGSATRTNNVTAAGATGALFTSTLDAFPAGISGNATIPVFQMDKTATNKLRPAAVAKTLNVTFDGSLAGTVQVKLPGQVDTLSGFSSRGKHGAPGVVKPDVTATGQTIISAGVGTGNGARNLSGTSMASPTAAGIAALVNKKHPTWTPEQIKAAVMNTAINDLYTADNKTGLKYGPGRVGAGRVDALYATTTSVLAYNKTLPGVVSVSFGAVEAPATKSVVSKSQVVTVENTSTTPTTVTLAYQGVIKQPGVTYSVSPTAVSLKGKAKKDVTVTMTVVTKSLRKTIDPTMETVSPTFEVPRQFVSDASGRLLVRPAGQQALRVPVYGAAKPVSSTKAVATTLEGGQKGISLVGAGFNQGAGPSNFSSKVSVLDLGYRSPKLPLCAPDDVSGCVSNATTKGGDLKYVGATAVTDADGSKAGGVTMIGINTWGSWAAIGLALIPTVNIDIDGDDVPDYQIELQNLRDAAGDGTDVVYAVLFNLKTGAGTIQYPINVADGDVDTNIFDTTSALIPVDSADLGLTDDDASYPIRYSVTTSYYGTTLDETPWVPFDIANPAVQTESPLYLDQNGTAIPYTLGKKPATSTATSKQIAVEVDAKAKKRTVSALLLHLNAAAGKQAEVLKLNG